MFISTDVDHLCSSPAKKVQKMKSDATDGGTFISEYASQFSFEQSEKIDKDWYEIDAQGGTGMNTGK